MINKTSLLIAACISTFVFVDCNSPTKEKPERKADDDFKYKTEQFADLQILRYQAKGFDSLTSKQKELVYYLYEAGLSGRDILYDQNYKHNLRIRKTLETIVDSYKGKQASKEFGLFMIYAKRVWFSNGIHHHYSTKKIIPEITPEYFASLVNESDGNFPLLPGETKEDLIAKLTPIIFDPAVDAKRVNQEKGIDMIKGSANNYYEGVTQAEVEAFYKAKANPADKTPVMYGLNSKLVKENGKIQEKVYKVGGLYSPAIEKIVYWLEKASSVAENENQKAALDKLIEYYKTGDLKTFDEYNIAWLKDTASVVDVINGFIEVYGDPMGYKGAYESVVSIKDQEASKRMAALSQNAQWFETNSPILPEHKKENVSGVSYKVITVVGESGDSSPSTPIGINLPNSNWVRKEHGSKSVSLGNIKDAYAMASSKGAINEFYYSDSVRERVKEHGVFSGNMHTALHEVIGHASGQLEPGISTDALKNYHSTLEEARADLIALYYIIDPKMVDIGVQESIEVGKAEYDIYIANGLMLQLRRLDEGDNLEESHMRNRQLISAWVFEKGKNDNVIEKKVENGKTFFVINDYNKLRDLFGQLLKEVQRIKSQGDYEGGKKLIETYGVIVDQELMKEVKERYKQFDSAPYSGFIQPKLTAVKEGDKIVDVKIEYPENFVEQMMEYGKDHSFLPVVN
ncbi:MAG TPA: dihydrofolate reductase [Cytophagales bacterium]|nr:dihydrofolate reductase [Cytophagales bacterium]